MENPQPLQLKYPFEQAQNPDEQLSLSCISEIVDVWVTAAAEVKILNSLFKSQHKTIALFVSILSH